MNFQKLILMAFLQKVSFCNFIRNNPWLFSACQRKKIVIVVASLISFLFLLNCATIKEAIDCERYRDKDYPSAVSNCNQTQKEFNNKIDTVREVRK
jgi:hypothetical protein